MKTEHYNTGLSPEELASIIRTKDKRLVNLIVRDMNKTVADATDLWFKSKTREYFDKNNMFWVADYAMLDELQLELNNDPTWMTCLFE